MKITRRKAPAPAPAARKYPHHPSIPSRDPYAADRGSDEADAQSLHEAEGDIGINDWLDPETGEPAEGQSPPRLEEE